MPELIPSTVIDDVVVVRPDVHGDERGRFVETYRRSWFPDRPRDGAGQPLREAGRCRWSACTTTCTRPTTGTCCAARSGSCCTTCAWARRTDGATEVIDLDGDVDQGVYIPPGVAHGFAALTDVLLTYLVDNYYDPADELGLAWDDPDVGADWGVTDPILSARDQSNPARDDIPDDIRPRLAPDAPDRRLGTPASAPVSGGLHGRLQSTPQMHPACAASTPLILLNRGRC